MKRSHGNMVKGLVCLKGGGGGDLGLFLFNFFQSSSFLQLEIILFLAKFPLTNYGR